MRQVTLAEFNILMALVGDNPVKRMAAIKPSFLQECY